MAYMERKTMKAGNHLVLGKLQSDNYAKHRAALTGMRPHIDNKTPRRYPHMRRPVVEEGLSLSSPRPGAS